MSRAFTVIGHPLGHTMSPFIHDALFQLAGRPGAYGAQDIPPEELAGRFGELRRLAGFNVTIPHKQAIIPLLDELDQSAARYGAVNTVFCGERTVGYNTDAYGFLKSLETAGFPLGGPVLLCGCGGVARTMAYECLLAGGPLTLAVRENDLPAAGTLRIELEQAIPGAQVGIVRLEEAAGQFDLLVNATPVGMYPRCDAMPVREEQLTGCRHVFDAVYNPRRTLLLKTAQRLGIPAVGGMPMLVWQAVRAHEIWDGTVYDPADIQRLVEASYAEMERQFQK
ncbi:MAG: shikimate dehydrogenase [Clostridiales bacterium]|nr:shikimate dehydrogenase [Clostridiales bacterium]